MRGGAALLSHLALDVPDAVGDGLRVEHHPAAAAVGVVVGLLLAVEGVVPDLVAVGLDVPPPGGPPQDALVQHTLAHLGEEGRDVYSHPHGQPSRSLTAPSSNRPGMGVTVMYPSGGLRSFKKASTPGNIYSLPSGALTV